MIGLMAKTCWYFAALINPIYFPENPALANESIAGINLLLIANAFDGIWQPRYRPPALHRLSLWDIKLFCGEILIALSIILNAILNCPVI